MANFKYAGVNSAGEAVKGVIAADSVDHAKALLKRQKIRAETVKKSAMDMELTIPGLSDSVSTRDLVIFTRTFSTMIDAGIPLVQSFEILEMQTENPALRKAIRTTRQDVEQGSTISHALRKHPRIFDDLYCNMVEAGETGGILDTVLNRLAGYMEKAIALKRKVTSALVYPSIVITFALVAVAAIMIFVIPVFSNVFVQLGTTMPLPTQIVITISHVLANYAPFIAIGLIVAFIAFRMFKKTERGRFMIDTIMLRMPIIGMLLRKVAVAKFTRTLSTLMSSGVPILDGLEITAKTSGNKVVEQAIMKTRVSISEGKTISEPLGQTDTFPTMVVQMIAVGEATGSLDTMLTKIADFYDDEVDNAVGNLTQLLEPALLIFLGVTIGGIVVAMYLPLFQAIGKLAGG
ncbi:MAG: type II secretion system F family protein [Candidatus Schekmanbacteria bacterium]|nr:type II secretion system F family protein [Candidatus Schekmanbacteria bacterium]